MDEEGVDEEAVLDAFGEQLQQLLIRSPRSNLEEWESILSQVSAITEVAEFLCSLEGEFLKDLVSTCSVEVLHVFHKYVVLEEFTTLKYATLNPDTSVLEFLCKLMKESELPHDLEEVADVMNGLIDEMVEDPVKNGPIMAIFESIIASTKLGRQLRFHKPGTFLPGGPPANNAPAGGIWKVREPVRKRRRAEAKGGGRKKARHTVHA